MSWAVEYNPELGIVQGTYVGRVTADEFKEATIKASHAFGMWNLVHDLDLSVEMMVNGEFPVKQLITHTFPLDQINEAFNQKIEQSGTTVKVEILY